jgi:hypothetical protein
MSMLLDIVEVARSHSGLNLAAAFAKILNDFGISDKVSRYVTIDSIGPGWRLTVNMQILSVTCDNASNNDAMVEELADLLDEFPGAANQTRCFTHVLNLVVKSIIRQFDSPDSKNDKHLDDAANEMLSFAGNIEFEDEELARCEEDNEDDNVEGWIDERTSMTEEELDKLDESVEPLRLLLMKVRYR